MNSTNQDDDSFASLFENATTVQRQRHWSIGDRVEGIVVKIGSNAVFLDLDGKREAFIDRASLADVTGQEATLSVGDTIVARDAEVGRHVGGVRLEPLSIRAAGQQEQSERVELVDAAGPRLSTGAHVKGQIVRVESYGVFLQIEGTTGREGRGLIPASETGSPKGTDLRKKFPLGTNLEAKVLSIADDGKIRLSIRALQADEERASFESFSDHSNDHQGGFGTMAAAFARSKNKSNKR